MHKEDNHKAHHEPKSFYKKVPLWKWILIIVLVIAMPLFFYSYRSWQLQQIIGNSSPSPSR